jgi:AcrR family transcriptional regulator
VNAVLPEAPAARKPGRPRDARADRAILEATLELASEHGLGLSMDAVAARAGVSKATIYRRWQSKEALLLDAWRELIAPVPVPDTGSLRGDLRAIYSHLCHHAGETPMGHVLPQMIAAARMNPEIGSSFSDYVAERRRPTRAVFERAVARGELPADTDFDLLSDLFAGPFFYRILVTDAPVDDQLVEAVLDVVLAGAEKARRR